MNRCWCPTQNISFPGFVYVKNCVTRSTIVMVQSRFPAQNFGNFFPHKMKKIILPMGFNIRKLEIWLLMSFLVFGVGRGCEETQPEVSAFWQGKENFVHKRFFIKYRQINIFKVKNTILYENCTLWAPTAYEKYCCHPLKIEKFVPNGKPLKYWHLRVGKCH